MGACVHVPATVGGGAEGACVEVDITEVHQPFALEIPALLRERV